MKTPVFLNDVLKREGNNFALLKLLAVIAIIVGHSYDIASHSSQTDILYSLLHFDNSASLAIKFLFFLGGLLATNSIISNPDAFRFLLKRAFRIFPALLVCLFACVFIIGPIFSKLSPGAYFSSFETWNYLFHNFFLFKMRWRLPGVFDASPLVLNGSLWTLPCALLCYILIAVFYGLGFLRNKTVSNVFFIAVTLCAFIAPVYLPSLFSQNPEAYLLPGCFALGALLANNKTLVPVNVKTLLLIWLLAIVLHNDAIRQFLFYAAFFYTAVYISSLDFVKNKWRLPFDASYGVFLYGYVIQQCVHAVLPEMGAFGNQLMSVIIALPAGIFSWYFIERRFIDFAHALAADGNQSFTQAGKINRQIKWPGPYKFPENNIIVFLSMALTVIVMHVVILRFIFPGYYSPFVPQHSDYYIPAEFAQASTPYIDLLFWPRPVTMIFARIIGYTGIHGSIACVVALVCINCILGALLIKRMFAIRFNGQLLLAFAIYCGLLFSQPYFYTFYAQDIGGQLAYFFLILGAHVWYSDKFRIGIKSVLFFCCCLLSFFSKETYELTALAIAFLWFIYARKKNPVIIALLPLLILLTAFAIGFFVNVVGKSTFVNVNAPAGSPYQISLNPATVFKEFFNYAYDAINIANLAVILLTGYGIIRLKDNLRKQLLFIITACIGGTALAILPNALLPNHHISGYSFNGAYLFYLPLLILPLLYKEKNSTSRIIVILTVSLCLISPLLNTGKYKENEWQISQETTQRNLLNALDQLISEIEPSTNPQKILVQGLTFPFHPFHHPSCLKVFPNTKYLQFDVINYNQGFQQVGPRKDLVMFINAADTNTVHYERKWVFDGEGKLISAIKNHL